MLATVSNELRGLLKAIHLICRRTRTGLERLTVIDKSKNLFESCCWAFRKTDDPSALQDGWVYLHPTKSAPSEFGGIIREVRPTKLEGKALEDRYVLVVEARSQGRGQKWRGANYGMAWTGGQVDARFART